MASDAPVPLEHYLRPLRNHKWLILAVALVVTVLGLLASTTTATTYRSTASILVTPISADPTSTFESDVEVGMVTEERIATSTEVKDQVAERLADQSITVTREALDSNVQVSSPKDSRILDVSYSASTAAKAQAGADTFAQTYLDYRSQLANEDKAVVIESLRERIALLQDELADVTAQQARNEADTEPYITATVEREAVKSELDAQQKALADLSTLSVEVGRIISPAELPDSAEGLGGAAIAVGSIASGLILGCLAAFALAAFKATDASSGGAVEAADPGRDADLADLFAEDLWTDAGSSEGRSSPATSGDYRLSEPNFDALMSRIGRTQDGSISCVCFGEASRDAAVATSLGLAVALQSNGYEVLVVDALLDAPALDGLLDIPSEPGLLDVVADSISLEQAQHVLPTMGGLRALTVGDDRLLADRQQVDELVNGWGMRRLLAETKPLYDATIFVGGTLADAGRLALLLSESTGLVIGTEQKSGEPVRQELADAIDTMLGRQLALISLNDALADRARGEASAAKS